MPSELEVFDAWRSQLDTRSGPVSYLDTGGKGRPALFVHGVATSSYLWRHVIGELGGQRRCVAVDLPLHGQTPAAAGQDFSLPGLAGFVADCCDALELTDIDLVANDTGGAIAQVFATRYADRLHTLTLTNCEAHDNVPPKGLRAAYVLARSDQLAHLGVLARIAPRQGRSAAARRRFYRTGYEDLARLPDEIMRAWLEPLIGTVERAEQYLRLFTSIRARDLIAAEPALTRLNVPTLVVWGTGDRFFDRKWAYWLRDTIPGVTEVVELEGARLFFPDERATQFSAVLSRHWDKHP